MTITFAVP